jgi:complement component 1 Q subcomponent-binding protein
MSAFCSVSYEGDVVVNDVEVSSDVSMSDTAETEYKRRYEYNPKYYQLDEQLQESIEDFIDEKIKDVGEFIVQYAEWKENSEYVSWLEKLKEFSK